MAIETLDLVANPLGTYVINIAPTDENDLAVTPETMVWSVITDFGTVINERDCIDYEADDGTGVPGTLSTSMDLVLNGPDLQVLPTESEAEVKRRLSIAHTYNSDLGDDLPGTLEVKFLINNPSHVCSS